VPQGALHPDLREEFLGILRHLHILFLWRANIEMGGTWRYHIQPTNQQTNKPTMVGWFDNNVIIYHDLNNPTITYCCLARNGGMMGHGVIINSCGLDRSFNQ